MLSINIRNNIKQDIKRMTAAQLKQIDFAKAQTVNELAKMAQAIEKKAMPEVFDHPTPFTVNSVAVTRARKGNPVATVYIRPIAAQYLAPYEYGGMQFLGRKPADLMPVNAKANTYGNLPRNAIAKYLGRPDTFLGTVGSTYGLWQRPTKRASVAVRGNRKSKQDRLSNTSGKLILLVAFHAPVATKKRLKFGERSAAMIQREASVVFNRQLAAAMASAKG